MSPSPQRPASGRPDYSKNASLVIIGLVYALATVAGIITFKITSPGLHAMAALLLSDVAATVVVWAFDVIFHNVSVYDPYWSVAPPVMFTAYAFYKDVFTLPVVLLLIAVWFWGVRLTANWERTFKGLGHEDWRYSKYREKQSALLFALTNFFGLVMMPTLLVFICMVPGFRLFDASGSAGWALWPGFAVCLIAASIQLVADRQSHRFRDMNPGQVCDVGLWRHGRHPNYFGEIMMWWGVWIMYASFFGIDWLILGPLAMTALFLFISIPMMERRQLQNKPGYADYKKSTRMLI